MTPHEEARISYEADKLRLRPKKEMSKTIRININLPASQIEEMKRLGSITGEDMSEMVRRALALRMLSHGKQIFTDGGGVIREVVLP